MTKYELSVIVCSYNPEDKVFYKCLTAISEAAKLSCPKEIIIVDNNSKEKISERVYIKDFIDANENVLVICENKQGLTPARLKGIEIATGNLLVFVDDDNFIDKDFFKRGLEIAEKRDFIGAFSGQVILDFETTPDPWTFKYLGLLVRREFEDDIWSNLPHLDATMPCGAGLFVKKEVADRYKYLHRIGKRDIQLDRNGQSLFSGGDNDLAACACDIGLGVGLFPQIKLLHYIPSKRLKKEYLLSLAEGISASSIVLKSFRGVFPERVNASNIVANKMRLLLKNSVDRQFFKASLRGEKIGRSIVESQKIKVN